MGRPATVLGALNFDSAKSTYHVCKFEGSLALTTDAETTLAEKSS
ncbi:MAG TPA: hypothetical protein VGG19_12930 [Tepidisphaeraceae bacterium]